MRLKQNNKKFHGVVYNLTLNIVNFRILCIHLNIFTHCMVCTKNNTVYIASALSLGNVLISSDSVSVDNSI